jgi:hypothetical protein
MKKVKLWVWLYCTVLAFVIVDIYFQERKKQGEIVALCGLAELGKREPKLSDPSPAARAAVRWIAAAAGMSPNFSVYQGDKVPSVAFAAIRKGKRIVVVDTSLFNDDSNRASWNAVCTIGHEIGHHLGSHLLTDEDSHADELEADQFAAYACALLGATLPQALSMTGDMSEGDSDSHPGVAKRRAAVERGWHQGEALRRTGKITLPASFVQ